jgi:hypothetical protein
MIFGGLLRNSHDDEAITNGIFPSFRGWIIEFSED